MTKVLISDLRHPTVQVCPRAKGWFEAHGLNWRDFVKNGVDIEVLRSTNDRLDLLDRLEEVAKEREARNG